MVKEWRDFRTVISIKDNIKLEKHMEKVYITGSMEKYTTENGITDFNKAMEFGKECKEIFMRALGSNHKQMDMEFFNTLMETDIKVIGNSLIKVDMALNFIIMDQFLKETLIMTFPKGKVK
jgi:hypothetical protein